MGLSIVEEIVVENHHLFIYTETPLHAGVGSSVSVVDLPIQRERATQYPIVHGSGVKGALRAYTRSLGSNFKLDADGVFGPDDPAHASDHAGAIAVGDAQIVLFPVRSLKGVFVYVTSAHVLARVARSINAAAPAAPPQNTAWVSSGAPLIGQKLVLEEFTFTAEARPEVKQWADWLATNALPQLPAYDYWRKHLQEHLIVLPEDDFRDFALNSTQIDTHVKLDRDKKTVIPGALWTTESLPPDTLLMSSITVRDARKENSTLTAKNIVDTLGGIISDQTKPLFQLGGDETTGQGVVGLRWL